MTTKWHTDITCDFCGGPIPVGGEGHPEICPSCIQKQNLAELRGAKREKVAQTLAQIDQLKLKICEQLATLDQLKRSLVLQLIQDEGVEVREPGHAPRVVQGKPSLYDLALALRTMGVSP